MENFWWGNVRAHQSGNPPRRANFRAPEDTGFASGCNRKLEIMETPSKNLANFLQRFSLPSPAYLWDVTLKDCNIFYSIKNLF